MHVSVGCTGSLHRHQSFFSCFLRCALAHLAPLGECICIIFCRHVHVFVFIHGAWGALGECGPYGGTFPNVSYERVAAFRLRLHQCVRLN